MKYKMEEMAASETSFEAKLNIGGTIFDVIFGTHLNGYFCCIPAHGVGCRMAEPNDTQYNREQLMAAGLPYPHAREIAIAIRNISKAMQF